MLGLMNQRIIFGISFFNLTYWTNRFTETESDFPALLQRESYQMRTRLEQAEK